MAAVCRNQRFLKPEHTATVQSAYWSRPALERAYCKHVYDRYLSRLQSNEHPQDSTFYGTIRIGGAAYAELADE